MPHLSPRSLLLAYALLVGGATGCTLTLETIVRRDAGSPSDASAAHDGSRDVPTEIDVAGDDGIDAGADVVARDAVTADGVSGDSVTRDGAIVCASERECASGEACCAFTHHCYATSCLGCCMFAIDGGPRVDAVQGEIATVDAVSNEIATDDVVATVDAGSPCTDRSACPLGQICVFDTPGCSVSGVCRTDFACGRPLLPYCSCQNVTFDDTCAGPPQRWVSQGPCQTGGTDGGRAESSFADGVNSTDANVSDIGTATDAMSREAGMPDGGTSMCTGTGLCMHNYTCCGGSCVYTDNDPMNCGGCGLACGPGLMCSRGGCVVALCQPGCSNGQVCCEFTSGVGTIYTCHAGTSCPPDCPMCA